MADAQTVLEKIAEHLEANPTVQSYTVDGVTVTRASLQDLLDARERLRAETRASSKKAPVQYFRRGPN